MGWWKIEYWRLDKKGNETTELDDVDLEHIAEANLANDLKGACAFGDVFGFNAEGIEDGI